MFNPTLLEQAFTTLFEQQDYGNYDTEEIDDAMGGMDYQALANSLWNKLETVYVYKTDGKYPKSFDYRSQELFSLRACLVCTEFDSSTSDVTMVSYCQELWLLEDYSFAVVNCVSINIPHPQYQYDTAFRTVKSMGKDCELHFATEEMSIELSNLCGDFFEQEIPFYEL